MKALSEIYSPFTGDIVNVNEELQKNQGLINEDPYGRGWIIKICPLNLEEESKRLLKPEQYAEYIKGYGEGGDSRHL